MKGLYVSKIKTCFFEIETKAVFSIWHRSESGMLDLSTRPLKHLTMRRHISQMPLVKAHEQCH